MDLEDIILSEVNQTEKDKCHVSFSVEPKNKYKWIYIQNRNRITNVEDECMVTKGEREEGEDKLGEWDCRYKPLYTK